MAVLYPGEDGKPSRHNKRWSKEEKRKLEKLAGEKKGSGWRNKVISHKDWKEIAKKMNRTKGACKSKWNEIQDPEKKKSYEVIEVDDNIRFRWCYGDKQTCSVCGDRMTGKYGLSIRKKTRSPNRKRDVSKGYNVWVHVECLENFLESIEKSVEENKDLIEEKEKDNLAERMKGM